jgi:hypothetical protein
MSRLVFVSLAALGLSLLPAYAIAGDGVIEINQACATTHGCVPGDDAGFPVTINLAGSYRLTSNLRVTAPDVTAVRITGEQIDFDLGGFEISGPVSCRTPRTPESTSSAAAAESPMGSMATAWWQSGMEACAGSASTACGCRVAGGPSPFASPGNGSGGILVEEQGWVTRVLASSNDGPGISITNGIVERCVASMNKKRGIESSAAIVVDNVSTLNGMEGYIHSKQSRVRERGHAEQHAGDQRAVCEYRSQQ